MRGARHIRAIKDSKTAVNDRQMKTLVPKTARNGTYQSVRTVSSTSNNLEERVRPHADAKQCIKKQERSERVPVQWHVKGKQRVGKM